MSIRMRYLVMVVFLLAPSLWAADAPWLEDRKEAFRIARQERKLVFADVRADWCAPCRMMEQQVFPLPDVQARLREYVLLRVDVGRSGNRVLPTYIVYDPQEHARFQFTGGMAAPKFLERLDRIAAGRLFVLQATDLFAQKKDVEAWTQLAKGYTKAGEAEQAREAWQRVQRGAADRVVAQTAAINGAFTWVLQGQGAKSVQLLKKIAEKPVNPDTEALSWFVLGQAYVKMSDVPRAREAFEKARTIVPAEHVVAREATAALAGLR